MGSLHNPDPKKYIYYPHIKGWLLASLIVFIAVGLISYVICSLQISADYALNNLDASLIPTATTIFSFAAGMTAGVLMIIFGYLSGKDSQDRE